MPTLRLFGPLAEAAGCSRDELSGASVEELLAEAAARYGGDFARLACRCRVWVNGSDPLPGAVLVDDDEVALLPPVSGG